MIPLLGDWNVLALSEGGWDDDTRRLIEAIAAATGLPVNPELEEWMALESLLHRAAGADPEERPALKAALACKAVRYFQMALEANPEDLDAALQLGYAWISAGELDEAGTVFAALILPCRAPSLGVLFPFYRFRNAAIIFPEASSCSQHSSKQEGCTQIRIGRIDLTMRCIH